MEQRCYRLRYAYFRSLDCQWQNTRGQDYLELRCEESQVAVAVADGVGQSFYGDLAARLIGARLLAWLWELASIPMWVPSALEESLLSLLALATKDGTRQVQNQLLPSGVPALHLEVLEKKRRLGSEAMLAGALVQMRCAAYPYGRLLLAWLGDTRVQLAAPDASDLSAELATDWNGRRRWSTRRGVVGGTPGILVTDLRGIGRVAVHTDGLGPVAHDLRRNVSDGALAQRLRGLVSSAGSDDVAFAELVLTEPINAVREGALKLGERPV